MTVNRSKRMLTEAQKMLNLNQKDFGTYIGVSARTVNAWMGKAESRKCPVYLAEMTLRLARHDAAALENGEQPSGMWRWAVVDADSRGEYLYVFGSRPEAIREADMMWKHLTDREKSKLERFEVALIHVTLTDSRHERWTYYGYENGVVDGDAYEVAKDYLSK